MYPRITLSIKPFLAVCLFGAIAAFAESAVKAQCPGSEFASGLQLPSKIIQSPRGNLFVAENGFAQPNGGLVSIVSKNGERHTLLSGLPSGINSNGDPSGTSGLFLRCHTLYIVNGEGDATLAGPIPGTEVPNPNP